MCRCDAYQLQGEVTMFGTSFFKGFLLGGQLFLESGNVGPITAAEGMGGNGRSGGVNSPLATVGS